MKTNNHFENEEYDEMNTYETSEHKRQDTFMKSLGTYGLLVIFNFKLVPFLMVFPLYLISIPIFFITFICELFGKFIQILSYHKFLQPIAFILFLFSLCLQLYIPFLATSA